MDRVSPKLSGLVCWIGGKSRMQGKIAPLLPYSDVYGESYCGAAAILFARRRSPNEFLNDLDGNIVNLFRAFQDPRRFRRLRRRLRGTPYAAEEFVLAVKLLRDPGADPDDRAWAMFVGQNQGFGGHLASIQTPTRAAWGRGMSGQDRIGWRSRLGKLEAWRDRLMGVQIDSVNALECLVYWDTPNTVHYVDPPYAPETRTCTNNYEHEADEAHHRQLVDVLLALKGAVALSGYDTKVYAPLGAAGWAVRKWNVVCDTAGKVRGSGLQGEGMMKAKQPRTEVLWRNPRCLELLRAPVQTALFAGGGE